MSENEHKLGETIRYLREAVDSAVSSPAAIGRETEEWLHRRERSRADMQALLADESIQAEMRVRDDVPRLLGHLVDALTRSA